MLKINNLLNWYVENCVDIEEAIGIDEVGRGPLAGPVVSCAVWISSSLAQSIMRKDCNLIIRDSKKLSKKQREKIVTWAGSQKQSDIKYAIGVSSVEEINRDNILVATMLSMRRSYEALDFHAKYVIIDGNQSPFRDNESIASKVKTVIKGDEQLLAIAIASIIAKQYRDNLMMELSTEFPSYGWDRNAGYGTSEHMNAIKRFGLTLHHRNWNIKY